jgi:hypothetical protein
MFNIVKALIERFIVVSHHLSCGLTGAFAFGFVAYLLDLGGFRTEALASGGVGGHALTALAAVGATFVTVNVLMKRLMGKHGVF